MSIDTKPRPGGRKAQCPGPELCLLGYKTCFSFVLPLQAAVTNHHDQMAFQQQMFTSQIKGPVDSVSAKDLLPGS